MVAIFSLLPSLQPVNLAIFDCLSVVYLPPFSFWGLDGVMVHGIKDSGFDALQFMNYWIGYRYKLQYRSPPPRKKGRNPSEQFRCDVI